MILLIETQKGIYDNDNYNDNSNKYIDDDGMFAFFIYQLRGFSKQLQCKLMQ